MTGLHTIRAMADGPDGDAYTGAEELFDVFDARQASAVISMYPPDWALPNKRLTVRAEITSLRGVPLETLKSVVCGAWKASHWTRFPLSPLLVSDNTRDEDDELLQGQFVESTDRKRMVCLSVDVDSFSNPPLAGTFRKIIVQYTGSSGEHVKESAPSNSASMCHAI